MTPEQFFTKNMKWIALALLFLLSIKSIQSCNRGTLLNMTKGQYIHTIDSLEKKYYTLLNQYDDTTKMLKFELRIAKEAAYADAADKKSTYSQQLLQILIDFVK